MKKKYGFAAIALAAAVALSACTGAGPATQAPPAAEGSAPPAEGTTLNVLMVGNPQMNDLVELTKDNFTAKTGITVNFTVLPENELRDRVAQDIANQAGQYDVATIGAYEASVWTANDWLIDLQSYADGDAAFDVADIMPAMKGVLAKDDHFYAIPFYGEAAFTMYRKDIFDQHGLTMPANPTWEDIRSLAEQLSTKETSMKPICLRGLPGWGENMAVLGSMLSSFGGGFYDDQYNVLINNEASKKAVNYYVDMVTKYGEPDPANAGFTECLNTMVQGQAAMWFDATSAATSLEAPDSTVKGKMGYADAPKDQLRAGWVWAWAWAMPKTTKNADAAWQFISWASSKDYEKLAWDTFQRVPDGKRISTAEMAGYKEATTAYAAPMLAAIQGSDPAKCQAQMSPGPGCQYLGIPEFADLGATIGQEMSAALTGQQTADEACDKAAALAQTVADEIKG